MVTGDTPYRGDSPLTVALKHIDQPIPLLPRELCRYQLLVDKMMAKDLEERISSAPQFNRVVDRILTDPYIRDSGSLRVTYIDPKEEDDLDIALKPTRSRTTVVGKYIGVVKQKLTTIIDKLV